MENSVKTNTVGVLEEVFAFLKDRVNKVKHVPGHVPQSGIGGCSWGCGKPQEPKCLYRKVEKLLNELRKSEA